MKPRFRSRELLVLLPVLGFAGLAFYWTRTERLGSAPATQVSTKKLLTPAPPVVKATIATRTSTLFVMLAPQQTVSVMSPPVGPGGSRKTTRRDRELLLLLKRKSGASGKGRPTLSTGDCLLVDGTGRIYSNSDPQFFALPGKRTSAGLPANQNLISLWIGCYAGFNPPPPLTLKGTVSIEGNKPVPFAFQFPLSGS